MPVRFALVGVILMTLGHSAAARVGPKPKYHPLPVSPPVAALQKYGALTVRTRLPHFKSVDAAHLGQVRAAIHQATPDMVFHLTGRGIYEPTPGGRFAPVPHDGCRPFGQQLKPYDGTVETFVSARGQGSLRINATVPISDLARRTPGLIWEVNHNQMVFVTLDGGRYVVPFNDAMLAHDPPLKPGVPAQWPRPFQHTLLTKSHLRALARIGAVTAADLKTLEAQAAAFKRCVAKWAQQKGITTTRSRKGWHPAPTRCNRQVRAFESTIKTQLDQRLRARKRLYRKAKGRLGR